MAIKYFCWQGETVDELDSKDFKTSEAFRAEQERLKTEYTLAGMAGYWSNRPCRP